MSFSSCGEWGLLSRGGAQAYHCCGAWSVGHVASGVVVHRLNCAVVRGIFLDQGLSVVPCIARQILNHWATRESQHLPN